ncbi:MAG: LysR family transcriptional regulator [Synergistaceae bacterium]|nr:LysR family transcriptional regulator [Synergistaceae bacterium]
MTIKQIDYILELAQVKNFNRAADNLFISQPTLTYQVRIVEDEIGFKLFERSPKGAVLTPAGEQFCTTLRNIRDELKRAIEQGQNFSVKYHTNISIGLPMRSAIYFLPDAIEIFERENNGVLITPHYLQLYNASSFLNGEEDILFARLNDVKYIPDIKIYSLFESKIYLITEKDDELARKEIIKLEDLKGRVLMVGGGSPPELKAVQNRIIEALNIQHFNSNDRETTLTNIKAHKGVCLAPGFLNDRNGEFAWTRFDCPETISCVLCTHASDQRPIILNFIELLQRFYTDHTEFMA